MGASLLLQTLLHSHHDETHGYVCWFHYGLYIIASGTCLYKDVEVDSALVSIPQVVISYLFM